MGQLLDQPGLPPPTPRSPPPAPTAVGRIRPFTFGPPPSARLLLRLLERIGFLRLHLSGPLFNCFAASGARPASSVGLLFRAGGDSALHTLLFAHARCRSVRSSTAVSQLSGHYPPPRLAP